VGSDRGTIERGSRHQVRIMATETTGVGTPETPTRTNAAAALRQVSAVLGEPLVAVIIGVEESRLEAWARGPRSPEDEAGRRLDVTLAVVRLLLEDEAPATIRAWFAGKNRMLGDRAPAVALADDAGAVVRAARAFSAYG
jgi:hypothetical protein